MGSRVIRVVPLLLAVLALSGCAVDALTPLPPDVVYPSIEVVADAEPMAPVTLAWQFEGDEVRLSVPVDAAVYQGAQSAQKSALFFREIDELEWIPAYYQAFIDDPLQEPLYESMLVGLRALRESLALDSDRYAELIITMVQSLEYRTDPVYLQPKFPIETVGDANGDCDDKTLLVAALLAREGYDVAILLFSEEQHVALGIRSDGSTFGQSGYALVEMTTPTLVGWVPEQLVGGITLESEPMVIRIGEGTRSYGSGRQTDAIRTEYDKAVARAEELRIEIAESQASLEQTSSEVETLRAEMDERAAAGDIDGHNALVPRFNTLIAEHNAAVEVHNDLIARQKHAVDTANRILEGQSDRTGLARRLGLDP